MTRESAELKSIMANYYGTEHYFKDMFLSYMFTDGVKAFAMNAGGGAFWFLQEVNGMIVDNKIRQSKDYFSSIHLIVKDGKADIILENNGKKFKKHIPSTDCPEGDWLFYYDRDSNVMIWHGEY